MKFAAHELRLRQPLWIALSELYLDTESQIGTGWPARAQPRPIALKSFSASCTTRCILWFTLTFGR